MTTQTKVVGPSKTNIVKSTQFVLKAQPALPAKGLHNANIGEVTNETGIENYVEINRIRVPAIGVKDAKGNEVALEKVYNIGSKGRGLASFLGDYFAWSGNMVAKEDIYTFDSAAAMNGKAVVVEVGYQVAGSKVTPYIKAFHPAGTVESPAAA